MNSKLVKLVKAWQTQGSAQQRGFDWSASQENWREAFPLEAAFISKLKPEIDRPEVHRVMGSTKFGIREKFLAVMIWGYGNRGYGPYRVTKILAQANAEAVLTQVCKLAQQGKPLEAYLHLSQNRLKQLGPSYGSKFLSFCAPREIGAPIYDSLVARWVRDYAADDFAGVSTNSANWSLKTYTRYFDWVTEHARELDCYPDEIEHVLFQAAEQEYSGSRAKQITKGKG
jgi:hypothetical protein